MHPHEAGHAVTVRRLRVDLEHPADARLGLVEYDGSRADAGFTYCQ